MRRETFAPGLFSVTFRAPALAGSIRPGQFVMVEVPARSRPYLRRAYSVADSDPVTGNVELLIKTIGAGTGALEELPETAGVRLLGPLGNAFDTSGFEKGERAAIVAGGIGAAPFPALLKALRQAGVPTDFYLGGRNERELSIRRRFDGLVRGDTVLTSDDGSLGDCDERDGWGRGASDDSPDAQAADVRGRPDVADEPREQQQEGKHRASGRGGACCDRESRVTLELVPS